MKYFALCTARLISILVLGAANVIAVWAAPLSSDVATGGEWRGYNKTADG